MGSPKYNYNPTTCTYERVSYTPWQYLVKALQFVGIIFVFSTGLMWTYLQHVDSPKEVALKNENELLKHQYHFIQEKVAQAQSLLAQLQDRDNNLYRTLFDANPLPATLRQAGIGGVDRYQDVRQQSELIANTQEKIDALSARLHVQTESYNQINAMAQAKVKRLSRVPAIRPVKNGRVVSGFGPRKHPVMGIRRPHKGLDFAARVGTPVYATGTGVVSLARRGWNGSFGNLVQIKHGYGYETRYAHLSRIVVKPNQKVQRGDLIGYSGRSGMVDGPHVHYEVIKNRSQVDPVAYLVNDVTPSEYEELLRAASQENQSMD